MKSTKTYWNPLDPQNTGTSEEIDGSGGDLKQLTLAIDEETGDYTRLTWFRAGYHPGVFGAKLLPYLGELQGSMICILKPLSGDIKNQ